jgi:transcriptional regulator with XRE-family HTH domain
MNYNQAMTLKEYLDTNGLSQAEFARRVNVDFTTVAKWLDGTDRHPKLVNMIAIQAATDGDVTIQDMWPEGFMSALK